MSLTANLLRDLDADATTVRVIGRLDVASAPIMRVALLKGISEHPNAILVDMTRCERAEPTALTVFAAAAKHQVGGPQVAIILYGIDESAVGMAERSALGSVPMYATAGDALAAAERTRSAQHRVRLWLPRDPGSPAWARDATDEAIGRWDVGPVRAAALLVVSELVTNAVVHAHSEVGLEVMLRDDFLHIRVRDASPEPPVTAPTEDPRSDHGRGMLIVGRNSTRWGVIVNPGCDGKCVWATISTRPVGA